MKLMNDYELEQIKNNIFKDDEYEEEIENELQIDSDMLQYFEDARIPTTHSTTFKKKKQKVTFKNGDTVTYKRNKVKILFGPYDNDGKQMYEIQLSDGSIQSVEYRYLK